VLFKTRKDTLCGGFSSIHWRGPSGGEWVVDKKCFIFSLKLRKVYKRLNDTYNLYFNQSYGPRFNGYGIDPDNKFYSICNCDPFKVPKNT
jgi:hypothetical protein